jgi:FAD/FMN-containing dehydrogenase
LKRRQNTIIRRLADTISIGRGQIHAAAICMRGRTRRAADHAASTSICRTAVRGDAKSLLHYFDAVLLTIPAHGSSTPQVHHQLAPPYLPRSHAAFHFLLDYIPLGAVLDKAVDPVPVFPAEGDSPAWSEILSMAKKRDALYLGVTKRHRPDKFLLTHALDGFSLALDFKVTGGNRTRMAEMMQDFDRVILEHGGRFYFAKNSETTAETALKFFGEETVARFRKLKRRCDPDGLLESDLYRRIFRITSRVEIVLI